ncbi:MAG: GTP-binding protein Era [Rhodobacteraceae bacterium TMED111]|nr:GTP-binding protein Era [Marinovum sp.]OUV39914.1 MAG: GTP-binding protein Era [Rhodobacteraceae bacterium TMED111]
MSRLTSSFWVQAYIKKLNLMGVPAFVVSHGDDTAGAIIVKVNKLNGDAVLFERSFSLDKNLNQWSKFESGDEKRLDELLSRQLSRDRDLWIVEIESRKGDPFLDDI